MFRTGSSCSCLSCSPNPPLCLTAPQPPIGFLSSSLQLRKVHRSSLLHSPFYCTPAFASLSMKSQHFLEPAVTSQCKCCKATSVDGLRCSAPLTGASWCRRRPRRSPRSPLVQTLLLLCVPRHRCRVAREALRTTSHSNRSPEKTYLCSSLRQPQQLIYTFATLHS